MPGLQGFPLRFFDFLRHLPFSLPLVLSGSFFHLPLGLGLHVAGSLSSCGRGFCGGPFRIGHFLIELLLHVAGGWNLSDGRKRSTEQNADREDTHQHVLHDIILS